MAPRLRQAAFGAMLAASVALLVANAVARQRDAGESGLQTQVVAVDLVAALGTSRIRQLPVPHQDLQTRRPLEIALKRCRQSLEDLPGSEPLIWRAGVLIGALQGRDAAWRWFRSHPVHPREVWQDAYAPGELPTQDLPRALKALQSVRPRWCRDLLQAQLHVRAGQRARALEVLELLRQRQARRSAHLVLLAGTMLAGLLLGLAAQGVLWALIARGRARPADRPLPFSGLESQSLAEAFILWLFIVLAGGFAFRHLAAWLTGRAPLGVAVHLTLLLALELAAAAGGLALVAVAARRAGRRVREEDGLVFEHPLAGDRSLRQGRRIRDAGWGVLIYLAALPVLFATAAFLSRMLPNVPTPPNPAATLALGARGVLEWGLLVTVVSVAAPVFEEVFFRGILYTALRRRLRALPAILASGFAFALVHPQLPLGFLPIWVLGIAFAWMVELRRSLVPSILAHMMNNTAALLLAGLIRLP